MYRSGIFRSFGEFTIAGDGLQNLGLMCWHLQHFSCHDCCVMAPRFLRSHSKDSPTPDAKQGARRTYSNPGPHGVSEFWINFKMLMIIEKTLSNLEGRAIVIQLIKWHDWVISCLLFNVMVHSLSSVALGQRWSDMIYGHHLLMIFGFPYTWCYWLQQFIPLVVLEWHSISIYRNKLVLYIKWSQCMFKVIKHLISCLGLTLYD